MFYKQHEFGKLLKDIRKQKGIGLVQLSKMTNIHRDTISRLENGLTIPKLDTLQFLSNALNVNLFRLFIEHTYLDTDQLRNSMHSINQSILENDIATLSDLSNALLSNQNNTTTKSHLILDQRINAEKEFIEIMLEFYEAKKDKNLKTIKKKILESNLYTDDVYKSSYYYFRLSFMIAYIYRVDQNFTESETILLDIKPGLEASYLDYSVKTDLQIILLSNLCFLYDEKKDYEETIKYSNQGIDMCLNIGNYKYLHLFYYRLGISLYLLRQMDYLCWIQKTINLLDAIGKEELKETILKVTNNKYPEIYDQLNI